MGFTIAAITNAALTRSRQELILTSRLLPAVTHNGIPNVVVKCTHVTNAAVANIGLPAAAVTDAGLANPVVS